MGLPKTAYKAAPDGSLKPVQLFSGPDSARAADTLRRGIEDRRDDWPYPHIFAPTNSEDVHVIGTKTSSTPGPAVEVVKYQVAIGKRFYLTAILFGYSVSFTPGQLTFTLDRNLAVGATSSQFMPEQGLINVPVALPPGSQSFPWPLQRARVFEPEDVVRIKGTNVSASAGIFICGLFGWIIPAADSVK